jgi:hypothetical protein
MDISEIFLGSGRITAGGGRNDEVFMEATTRGSRFRLRGRGSY